MKSFATTLVRFALGTVALASPLKPFSVSSEAPTSNLFPRQGCENTETSRNCWGDLSTDTNVYTQFPDTGVTREYWINIEESECVNDGYRHACQTINGTSPGPLIWANWGDHLVVHVTNTMSTNGTAIHWHGLHQRGSTEQDGVPGVTQCPIPGDGGTMTYRFHVTQYGSTWYHSHFTLQAANGVFGPMIFYGPTTANYDIDMGPLFLQDSYHITAFEGWATTASKGGPPPPANILINGTNTFDCTNSTDTNCIGGGKKFEATFEAGKKHLIRLINVAADAHFQFSLDGHDFQVVAMDLVPIVPFTTKSLEIAIAQRYDIIVEANATPGDYWLRSGADCTSVSDPTTFRDSATGIIRYSNNNSTADPTSTSDVTRSGSCGDEPVANLVPYVPLDVGTIGGTTTQTLGFSATGSGSNNWFQWTLNSSSLVLDWGEPVLKKTLNQDPIFPTSYNMVAAQTSASAKANGDSEWFVLIIDGSSIAVRIDHPIHLHGHDFFIMSQSTEPFSNTTVLNTVNPPRRDTATLPSGGHIAMAFQLDNPGEWICHCHIAWHASQGLSLNFVEDESSISVSEGNRQVFDDTCAAWDAWEPTMPFHQDDSGI